VPAAPRRPGAARALPQTAEIRGPLAEPGLALAIPWVLLSLLWIPGYQALPRPGQWALEVSAPFRSVNPYGLFAVMTTDRIEVTLEGSWDGGQTWKELDLRYKPGPVDRVPAQIAPHMPRVDWQLWFAGLATCQRNAWVEWLMQRVADGSPAMADLFVAGTFDAGFPLQVRALAYRYTFSPPGADTVWDRELLGRYCPDTAVRER
jgi:lipase maturation factor 1